MAKLSDFVFIGGERYALAAYPRDYVARISQQEWLATNGDLLDYLEDMGITPDIAQGAVL